MKKKNWLIIIGLVLLFAIASVLESKYQKNDIKTEKIEYQTKVIESAFGNNQITEESRDYLINEIQEWGPFESDTFIRELDIAKRTYMLLN